MKTLLAGAVSALAMVCAASAANATVQVYTLNVSDAAAGLGAGPFGTVTVNDAGGNLAFNVSLNAGYEFRYSPDNNHWDFGYNLTTTGQTVTGVSSPFVAAAGTSFNDPPFGSFNHAIDCPSGPCTPGWNPGVNPTTLAFTVNGVGFGALTSRTYNNSTVWFAADIVNANGNTGNVGATLTRGSVPEPATWAMMILGFGAVGVALRRRNALAAA